MLTERDALASITSSSLDGGVGGAWNGIVLGEALAPTAEPDADPESPRLLAVLRSPDKLVRRRVGVELRLLALEAERKSAASLA